MHKKKMMIVSIITMILLVLIILGVRIINKKDTGITFKEIDTIEYGDTKVTSKTLVDSYEGDSLTYPKLDVQKVGNQTLVYILHEGDSTKEIEYEVTIKDTKKPVIKLYKENLSITIGAEFDPITNIESIHDPIDKNLTLSSTLKKGTYCITSNVDKDKEGTYEVSIRAKDKHNNIAKKYFMVTVEKNEVQYPENDPTKIQPTYVKGILLVNKYYGLPQTFGETDPQAYAALAQLQAKAKEAGFDIPTISGYRSYETQIRLYNDYVAMDGKEAADRYSARPGFSEHQSGLCFDVGLIDNDYGNTPEGQWLEKNCATFGYIIRYPNGKEDITGYMYEPWHIRYVGVEHANKIMENGSTLEEYLGVLR